MGVSVEPMRVRPGQMFHSGGIRYLIVNTSGLTLPSGQRRPDASAMVISNCGERDLGRLWPIAYGGSDYPEHYHHIPDVWFEEIPEEVRELSKIPAGIPFVAKVGVEMMLILSNDGLVFGMGGNSFYANDIEWELRPVLHKFVWAQKIQGER